MHWRDYERLLNKVAILYYNEEKSQQQIAEILQLSRSKVCRMLAEAKNIGLVQIYIKQSLLFCNEIESRLERQFGLREAIVVNSDEEQNLMNLIGEAGADYLKRIVTSKDIIGVSWGQTILSVVNQLQPFDVTGTKIVQLVGGLNNSGQNVQAVDLTRRLGELFNSEVQLLHCPALVINSQVKQGLLEDLNIRNVLEIGKKATIALLGIGNMSDNSELFKNKYLSSNWHSKLIKNGAVGDVCMRFFNKDGVSCCKGIDDQVMGITLENIKNIRTVICIAYGIEKAEAILGALNGRIPDVLITDKITAELVLELCEKGGK